MGKHGREKEGWSFPYLWIEPGYLALQADSLLSKPSGKELVTSKFIFFLVRLISCVMRT